jgi:uncharacterized membrane protein YgcG
VAIVIGILALLGVGGAVFYACAGDAPVALSELRNPRRDGQHVVDKSGVLTPVIPQINRLGAALAQHGSAELVVITVPKTVGTPREFARKARMSWGLGRGKDNGVVMLLTTSSPRRLEWEVGPGAQRAGITYPKLQQIDQRSVLPLLRSGNVTGGTVAGLREVAAAAGASDAAAGMPVVVRSYRSYWGLSATIFWTVIAITVLLFVFLPIGWGCAYAYGWWWYGGPAYYGYYYDCGMYMGIDCGGYMDCGGYADCGGDCGGDCDCASDCDCSSDCAGGDW